MEVDGSFLGTFSQLPLWKLSPTSMEANVLPQIVGFTCMEVVQELPYNLPPWDISIFPPRLALYSHLVP